MTTTKQTTEDEQTAVERVCAMAATAQADVLDDGSEQYEFRRRMARHVRAAVMLQALSEHHQLHDHQLHDRQRRGACDDR